MTYAVVSPAEIATVSFWQRLFELDWVVCNTDTVSLPADVTEAILSWLTTCLEHPVQDMTIGHFHLFIERFSLALGHPVPVVGPKFLSGAVASNSAHTRVALSGGDTSVRPFIALLEMAAAEQKMTLGGAPVEPIVIVPPLFPVMDKTTQVEEGVDAPRVHHRAGRVRRSPKGSTAGDRQGQSADPGQSADDATGSGTTAGSSGD